MEQRQGLLPSPPPPCLAWNPHHASRSPRVHPPTPPLTVGGLPMFPASINRGWCVIGKTLNIGPPHGPDHWSFFFFLINLFIFGCIGFSLLHAGFLQLQRAGDTLRWGMRASYCGGFSCCGAWALGTRASVVVAQGLRIIFSKVHTLHVRILRPSQFLKSPQGRPRGLHPGMADGKRI